MRQLNGVFVEREYSVSKDSDMYELLDMVGQAQNCETYLR